MNVYDFDGTIYHGDSTIDFYLFELKRNFKLLRFLPKQIIALILYSFGIIDITAFKEHFFSFLKGIRDIDYEVECFWQENYSKIYTWYLERKTEYDLIISASPEFLLGCICHRLGVQILGSKVDKKTGKYAGHNCFGEEKVRRYKEYTALPIEVFFSDSILDSPLADIAREAFIVEDGKMKAWNTCKSSQTNQRGIDRIAELIRYISCGCCSVALNWVCYFCLFYAVKLPSSASSAIAWFITTTAIFFLNREWVFHKSNKGVIAFIQFFGSRLATGVLDISFMTYTVDVLELNAVFCKFISTAVCTILNYLASKLVVFK